MIENGLKTKITSLPSTPGIYIYKDATGDVLYVGKAKNLRSRVRSYFTKSASLGPLKEKLITLITDLETISTDTELEALVLEATLIHKHQPPYNVLLRDDKYYLFIKVTKEEPPRIFPVRKMTRDGSRYFGPYSSAFSVRATLRLLQRIFPFKGEKSTSHDIIFPHVLFREKKNSVPFSPIGEKVPPPAGGADDGNPQRDDSPHPNPLPELGEGSGASIANVIRFLKGHRQEIMQTLEHGIQEASKNLEFERAALFRDQLQAVQRLEGSQKVYLPRKESFDVISIADNGNQSAANVLQIREGKLIGKQTFLLKHKREGAQADTLRQFLLQYYAVAQDVPRQILIPLQIEDASVIERWIGVKILTPERGVRKALIAMGDTNAKEFLKEQGAAQETARASKEALGVLLEAIGIVAHPVAPFRIEVYDISNTQGTLATASMIVFVDGIPEKKEYRKFKIKFNADLDPTMHKSNDFAMLEETLTRRLTRTDWPTPDLLIIDGGKGQLSSAMKAVRLASLAHGKPFMDIPIISIAKQEEIIYISDQQSSPAREVRLAYDSPALYLIQRMRDEAHRFTITFHRSLRSKDQIKSALDEVPGIGPKTKKLLIKTFGSVKGIKSASDTELEKAIGAKKTKVLREHL